MSSEKNVKATDKTDKTPATTDLASLMAALKKLSPSERNALVSQAKTEAETEAEAARAKLASKIPSIVAILKDCGVTGSVTVNVDGTFQVGRERKVGSGNGNHKGRGHLDKETMGLLDKNGIAEKIEGIEISPTQLIEFVLLKNPGLVDHPSEVNKACKGLVNSNQISGVLNRWKNGLKAKVEAMIKG